MNFFRYLMAEAQFHGSKRIKERKHRPCWAITLALCFWAACSLISATITRFLENPNHIVIWEKIDEMIKFPSIGVCPEVVYPEYKVDEVLSKLKYPPGMNKDEFKQTIQQLAAFYSPDVTYSTTELKKIEILLDYNNLSIEHLSRQLTASCEESITRCRSFGFPVNCSDLFVMELTNYGYCCTFNGRSLRKEIVQNKFEKEKPLKGVYSSHTGQHSGLMFVVNSSQKLGDIDLTYKWIYLEEGLQYVEVGGNGTPMSPNTEFWLTYDSNQFLIADDAKSLSPELRRCRLSSEKLKYFPKYSKRYCYLECEMRRTMRRCQCVRFTHPRPNNWRHCDANNLLCAKNSAVPYGSKACSYCLPTCESTTSITSSRVYALMPGSYIIDPFYKDINFSEMTVVRVFILRHNTKIFARRSYYTSVNLFSQIGGLMNVFFGCSIMTVLELLQLIWYACRQYQAIRRNRRVKQKAKQQVTSAKAEKTNKQDKKKVVRFRRRC